MSVSDLKNPFGSGSSADYPAAGKIKSNSMGSSNGKHLPKAV